MGELQVITSQQKSLLSEILENKPIPEDTLVYFRERLRDRLHSTILEAFVKRSQQKGLKQKELATRIHRTGAQIARWFSTPSNITLDSISDLMVGLGMDFDDFPYTPIEETIAPKEEKVWKKSADNLVSTWFSHLNAGLAKTEMDALIKILKRWPTEASSVGTGAELAETMQPKPQSQKVIDLLKYKQEAVGQSQNTFSQIGETNAQQKQA